ncbi:hypothetical protein HYDPIDRAFT_44790 [Hydnomerulius pinastri MD-312]|uniref:Uncharacterized protein n=1 Tax=Hydnomerulius pinastri MD-312 TaxID=994086 RepID=A0A0C9VJW4_9AGAM|nr:hypothetical protein HYDPIDRAFT_44790 [Hydnomerulius pinastri MD-312]
MAPNRKKRARSLESHDSDTELRRHSEKRVKKHAQKVKRRGKKRRSDDLDSDSSESDSDSSGTESDVDEEFKAAARAITRCVDMFCNVEKVIQVVMYIGQEEASRSGELEEDEVDRTRRKKFLNELSSQTTERYKRGYDMLLHLAPSLKELIGNASKKQELKKVTQAMNSVIKLTRSDDCSRLRDKIGHYAAPNPAEAALSPPIYIGGTSRSHMGLNHPVLA